MYVVNRDQLPYDLFAHEMQGAEHGDVGISLLLVEAAPGEGPALHRHDYDEIFIVEEGVATFFAGDEEREVRGGQIAVAPAGTPHQWVNTGDGPLRQVDIHLSPRFVTEWLS